MEVFGGFGPKIVKYNLSDKDTQSLYDICKPNDQKANPNLVGYLREEYYIVEQLKPLDVYQTIHQNMESYLMVDCGFYNNALLHGVDCLELTNAWYNRQIALEYNPPHVHYPGTDLVCVIFPKISLDNSAEHFTNNKDEEQLGQLHFRYGEASPNGFGKTQITVQPEEGEMYIFPSTLSHYTSPVVGNSVRYSISCNFNLTQLALKATFSG